MVCQVIGYYIQLNGFSLLILYFLLILSFHHGSLIIFFYLTFIYTIFLQYFIRQPFFSFLNFIIHLHGSLMSFSFCLLYLFFSTNRLTNASTTLLLPINNKNIFIQYFIINFYYLRTSLIFLYIFHY